jgi:hypothetical protein
MTHLKRIGMGAGCIIALVAAVETADWLAPTGGTWVVLMVAAWLLGFWIEDLRREET